MEQFYNKHYIKVDSSNRIVEGWSDGPHRDKDTTDAICINDKGGYQFRINGGEENPSLFDWNGMIPLYKYESGEVMKRTEEEIEADRQIAMQPTAEQVRAERDRLLAETDWTQVLDAPVSAESRAEMRVYRQALRDITEQPGFPAAVEWPVMPEIVSADPDPVDEAVDVLLGGAE